MYIFFLDIDNTVKPAGKPIPPYTVNAAKRAIEEGNKVFLNTGRGYSIIPKELIEEFPLSGIVAGLGSHIIAEGMTLLSHVSTRSQLHTSLLLADRFDFEMKYEGENETVYYNSEKEPRFTDIDDFYKRFPNANISKFTILRHLSDNEVEALEKHFEVVNMEHYSELMFDGYNKASAIEFLRKYYGVDHAHTVAMGDSGNDLTMLKAAGISVAMGNADEEIKRACDFVTLPCDEGGVGHAMAKILNW